MWLIVAWNVLMAVWLIWGVAAVASSHGNCGALDVSTCNSAREVGGAIGAALIVFVWVAGDIIGGVIWLVTRQRRDR